MPPASPPRSTSQLDGRDPAFIRAVLPALARSFQRYHAATTEGLDRLPAGAALIVGSHNGGPLAPDMFALMAAYWERFGAEAPAYGLMHDFVFRLPFAGAIMSRLGAVPARPENAVALLGRGAKVLVYPGGDLDGLKAHARRHEIIFGERLGFIRVAIRTGAPIVPVVSVGAHEIFRILADGAEFARRSGWKRLTRLEVFPVTLSIPFGLTLGPIFFYLPIPVRMNIRVLDPISWPELTPAAADDDRIVRRCRDQVRDTMQEALDDLVRQGGFGPRPLSELLSRPQGGEG
jgi:1-acyl-sn-glycerol-3-phosphate acyltransferase